MNANRNRKSVTQILRRGPLLAALLASALTVANVSHAQSNATPNSIPAATPAASAANYASSPAADSHANAPHEGIAIHGHWTIVVRNPDGTVTARRDFENALGLAGINLMQELLGGIYTPGTWSLSLGNVGLAGDTYATGPCTGVAFAVQSLALPPNVAANSAAYSPVKSTGNCFIGESRGAYAYGTTAASFVTCANVNACSPTLARNQIPFKFSNTTPPTVTGGGFQLVGTATASTAGTIDTVATLMAYCNAGAPLSGIDPNACTIGLFTGYSSFGINLSGLGDGSGSPVGEPFTVKFLTGGSAPAPVNVQANQTIQVTVVFTFN
jgi:hypothetical protein